MQTTRQAVKPHAHIAQNALLGSLRVALRYLYVPTVRNPGRHRRCNLSTCNELPVVSCMLLYGHNKSILVVLPCSCPSSNYRVFLITHASAFRAGPALPAQHLRLAAQVCATSAQNLLMVPGELLKVHLQPCRRS
jgi:hypothetical protein